MVWVDITERLALFVLGQHPHSQSWAIGRREAGPKNTEREIDGGDCLEDKCRARQCQEQPGKKKMEIKNEQGFVPASVLTLDQLVE